MMKTINSWLLVFFLFSLGSCKVTEDQVLKIHNEAFTIDTHVDTPYHLLDKGFDIGIEHSFKIGGSCVDFYKNEEGRVG